MMEQTKLDIRPVGMEDIANLASFSIQTFYDTYQAYNSPEDMRAYVSKYFSIDQLLEDITTPGTIYFLAKEGEDIVGYIKLRNHQTPESIEHLNPVELERIYVDPAQKGKGIGTALLDKACFFAKDMGYHALWLGVWEKNKKAIRFYEQYGFSNFGKQLFVLGNDIQEDIQYIMEIY